MSPVIATTIILAITITLGLGLWSFATSGVSTATDSYARVVTEYGKFTSDRFVIANIDFNNPSSNHLAFWIYNSGKTPTTVNNVVLTSRDCAGFSATPDNLTQDNPADPLQPLMVNSKALKKFYFDTQASTPDLPSCTGMTFELTVVSDTGASQVFIKKE